MKFTVSLPTFTHSHSYVKKEYNGQFWGYRRTVGGAGRRPLGAC